MRSRIRNCISILLICAFLPSIATAQVRKIYFNPKAPGNAKQSNFVDSIHFFPLEIRDDNKLILTTNLSVTTSHFLITDYANKTVSIYTRSGRFVSKISYKKLGESFYPVYDELRNKLVLNGNNKNYTLTSKDLIKIRSDWENQSNKKYFRKYEINLNDSIIRLERVAPDENDIVQAYRLYDDKYWRFTIATSPLFKDSVDYELKAYKDRKLVKKYFPYNPVSEPKYLFTQAGVALSKTDTPYIHFVMRPYCDTIYRMIGDSVFPYVQVVMPMENSLPPSFFTKPFRNKTDRENFQRNNGWVLRQIQGFQETPLLYYFTVSYQSNYESYIYQKKGNATYKTRSVKADSSQFNLQLLSDLNQVRNKDKFYKLQKAGVLIDFFEKHPGVPVPKELEAFLKSKPDADSPIIVEYKLKSTS